MCLPISNSGFLIVRQKQLNLVAKGLVTLLWYFLFQAENVSVTKDIRRVENAYHMEAEVCNDGKPLTLWRQLQSSFILKLKFTRERILMVMTKDGFSLKWF